MKAILYKGEKILAVPKTKILKKYAIPDDMFGCRFCIFAGKEIDGELKCIAPGSLEIECGELEAIWMSKREYKKYISHNNNPYENSTV